MKISKVKIRLDNSDGTYLEITNNMPFEIADKIVCDVISWKEVWYATVRNIEEYQKSDKEFIETQDKKTKTE